MKLAGRYIISERVVPPNRFFSVFKNFLEQIIHAPTPDNSAIKYKNGDIVYDKSDQEKDFYDNIYIPISSDVNIKSKEILMPEPYEIPKGLKIGIAERHILDFIHNGDIGHRLIVNGKKGWGKTTLLKYICFNAIPVLNSIPENKKCAFLYISFNSKLTNLSKDDYEKEFYKIVLDKMRNYCEETIENELDSPFYQYLLEKDEFYTEKRTYNSIKKKMEGGGALSDKVNTELQQLKDKILQEKDKEVVLSSFAYFQQGDTPKIPLLVLDDLDPTDTSIQKFVYMEMYKLAHEPYRIKVILSLRPLSLDYIERAIGLDLAIRAKNILQLGKPKMSEYLEIKKQEIEKCAKRIRDGKITAENSTITISDIKDFFLYYLDMLTQNDALEILTNLSDGDLRTFNELLETVLQSGYLEDNSEKLITDYIAKKATDDELKTKKQLFPLWRLYASIITANHETVFGKRNGAKQHVINILCNGRGEFNTLLIRLHILTYFMRKGSKVAISDVFNNYKALFPSEDTRVMQKSIRRAFLKFINTRIVGNNKRLAVDENDTQTEKYDNDSLYLEDIGKFYYNDLTNVYEYFLYMKDDVEFDEGVDIKDCIEIKHRYERFAEVVKYFKHLFEKEKLFYNKLSKKGKETYKENFAPYSGELFYSEWFVKNMIKYVRRTYIDPNNFGKLNIILIDLENFENKINITINNFKENET